MRFHVPQFIDVEDKIFGPLTFKQFVYLIGGGGISYVIYRLLPSIIGWPLILVIIPGALALAFYKVNNRPFIFVLESGFRFFTSSKLYIWKKVPKEYTSPDEKEDAEISSALFVPKLSNSKLKDIAWSIDVHQDAPKNPK